MKHWLWILVVGVCFAQTPEFDVASIKANKSNSGNSRYSSSRGLLRLENQPVSVLITGAFDILDEQIAGAPDWVSSDTYDIVARYEEDSSTSNKVEIAKANNLRLQSLLVSRYGLKFHRETRELNSFALVEGRKGAKLIPTAMATGFSTRQGAGHWEMKGATLDTLARTLAGRLGQLVKNETKLEGRFDIVLDFDPDARTKGSTGNPIGGVDARKPSLFTAIQEQLGLRLESRKAPVEMLVIDRIERPTEN